MPQPIETYIAIAELLIKGEIAILKWHPRDGFIKNRMKKLKKLLTPDLTRIRKNNNDIETLEKYLEENPASSMYGCSISSTEDSASYIEAQQRLQALKANKDFIYTLNQDTQPNPEIFILQVNQLMEQLQIGLFQTIDTKSSVKLIKNYLLLLQEKLTSLQKEDAQIEDVYSDYHQAQTQLATLRHAGENVLARYNDINSRLQAIKAKKKFHSIENMEKHLSLIQQPFLSPSQAPSLPLQQQFLSIPLQGVRVSVKEKERYWRKFTGLLATETDKIIRNKILLVVQENPDPRGWLRRTLFANPDKTYQYINSTDEGEHLTQPILAITQYLLTTQLAAQPLELKQAYLLYYQFHIENVQNLQSKLLALPKLENINLQLELVNQLKTAIYHMQGQITILNFQLMKQSQLAEKIACPLYQNYLKFHKPLGRRPLPQGTVQDLQALLKNPLLCIEAAKPDPAQEPAAPTSPLSISAC